ncbi:synapse differentiation-inducing gene protein 1-like [Rhineura floridana]|uniref:synapse differentiation-inducing gene protein 1-like n=1 Tax=Rhineura floridana TaxID=261503 RepID=UPI002AC82073|nr:synapse differentiation-inducing gene protein 1-like [Rhineura floridana]
MSSSNYEKLDANMATTQNPPPYSEKQPYAEPDPLKPPADPAPHMAYGAMPAVPPHYQPYYGPPGTEASQGPVLQPQQAIFITPVQPTNVPDYLAYSIFTMLCCCLPLGIASLVYSIQTREANLAGNAVAAQRNSRLARIFAHSALGIGLGFLILYIIIMVIVYTSAA